MIVVAIDPGFTTGVAVATGVKPDSRDFTLDDSYEVEWDKRFSRFHDLLSQLSRCSEPVGAIVLERFVLYPNEAHNLGYSDFPSVQIIGIVGAYAHVWGLSDHIVMQTASQRKSVQILDEHYHTLRDQRSKHIRDAYQHLRYYIVMQAQHTKRKAKENEK